MSELGVTDSVGEGIRGVAAVGTNKGRIVEPTTLVKLNLMKTPQPEMQEYRRQECDHHQTYDDHTDQSLR